MHPGTDNLRVLGRVSHESPDCLRADTLVNPAQSSDFVRSRPEIHLV
jgi:hypothetical protein